MNHTTSVRFTDNNGTTDELVITQRYNGLNIWDQLDVNIEVNGNLPQIVPDASITYADAMDTYVFQGNNRIVSDGSGAIQVNDENITFVINQVVSTTWYPMTTYLLVIFVVNHHLPSPVEFCSK